jgi:hypothetical protein
VVVLAGGVALTAINDPLGRVRRQYDRFVNLRVDPRQDSRFFSGGGYRYDYWRVALDQFRDHPLEGVGAGNYDRTYFRERRTSEDIRQPHSIELQTLGELGLVGGTALAAFLVAVLAGLGRAARRARDDSLVRVIAVAGGGAFVAWLVHTSVDWLHLIPGVTGVALCAAAMLLGPSVRPVRSGLRVPRRTAATGAVAVAAVVVAVGVGRLGAAEAIRTDGREQLASDPIKALRLANESLDLDREALPTLYLKSAAYARLGLYQRARTPLIYATGLEPHNFLPWALLGDLAVRRAEFRRARRYYRRAHSMNPRDFRLERLAADPRLALAKS